MPIPQLQGRMGKLAAGISDLIAGGRFRLKAIRASASIGKRFLCVRDA